MDRVQPARPVTVALVEDHPVAAEGVSAWFAADPARRVELVAVEPSLDPVLALDPRPDVLVLDLDLDGVQVTDRVPHLAAGGHRVVVFSALTDAGTIGQVHAGGARAFVGKNEGRAHLIDAVVAVAADRPYVTPSVGGAIAADAATSPRLSDRERRVLLLWFQSMSKQAVAARLGISESAVRRYVERARLKYTAQGRVASTQFALLARAIEDGLVRPEEIQEYRSDAAVLADRPT